MAIMSGRTPSPRIQKTLHPVDFKLPFYRCFIQSPWLAGYGNTPALAYDDWLYKWRNYD